MVSVIAMNLFLFSECSPECRRSKLTPSRVTKFIPAEADFSSVETARCIKFTTLNSWSISTECGFRFSDSTAAKMNPFSSNARTPVKSLGHKYSVVCTKRVSLRKSRRSGHAEQ